MPYQLHLENDFPATTQRTPWTRLRPLLSWVNSKIRTEGQAGE